MLKTKKTIHNCQVFEALLFVDFLEDVLETTIVALQNGVLSRHVKRPLLGNRHLKTSHVNKYHSRSTKVKEDIPGNWNGRMLEWIRQCYTFPWRRRQP